MCGVDKRLTAVEVSAPLREQIIDGKIAQVADKVACCCSQTNAALANLSAVVNNITKVVIPNSAICPGWGNVSVEVTPTTTTAGA